ncbi:DUF1328 domain-containing protein [Sphingomonas bacterium]|uniref:DUF1328 domain-containing protein n=1 Tax=Sphingomonas bacterium TaxID=1895847 RepID=UPI0015776D2E
MLKWALIFAVVALLCGLFGFTGAESVFATIAKILFGIAIVVFLIFLVLALSLARR